MLKLSGEALMGQLEFGTDAKEVERIARQIGIIRDRGVEVAIVVGAVETIISPRRGGPRFVDPAEQERAAALAADSRTLPQLALDALVDIVRLAASAESADVTALFGTHGDHSRGE